MAWKARIEAVLVADGAVKKVMSAQTMKGVGASKQTSAAMPAAGKDGQVFARVTVLAGALLTSWGPAGHDPDEADAIRLTEDHGPVLLDLQTGSKLYIVEAADAERGGIFKTAPASFVRPADTTAYAAGDRVADSTSAATVLELPGVFRAGGELAEINRLVVRKSGPVLTNAQFRVHLFNTLPVSSANDNAAFASSGALTVTDLAGYQGSMDVTVSNGGAAGARGAGVPAAGSSLIVQSANVANKETSLWAIVEALAAYVPTSGETISIEVEGKRS